MGGIKTSRPHNCFSPNCIKCLPSACKSFPWHGFYKYQKKPKRTPNHTNWNYVMDLSTICHLISKRNQIGTFNFTEKVHSYGLKQETVCQTVKFISDFFLKLHTQFWKHFHTMVLCSVGSDYYKIGCQTFCPG